MYTSGKDRPLELNATYGNPLELEVVSEKLVTARQQLKPYKREYVEAVVKYLDEYAELPQTSRLCLADLDSVFGLSAPGHTYTMVEDTIPVSIRDPFKFGVLSNDSEYPKYLKYRRPGSVCIWIAETTGATRQLRFGSNSYGDSAIQTLEPETCDLIVAGPENPVGHTAVALASLRLGGMFVLRTRLNKLCSDLVLYLKPHFEEVQIARPRFVSRLDSDVWVVCANKISSDPEASDVLLEILDTSSNPNRLYTETSAPEALGRFAKREAKLLKRALKYIIGSDVYPPERADIVEMFSRYGLPFDVTMNRSPGGGYPLVVQHGQPARILFNRLQNFVPEFSGEGITNLPAPDRADALVEYFFEEFLIREEPALLEDWFLRSAEVLAKFRAQTNPKKSLWVVFRDSAQRQFGIGPVTAKVCLQKIAADSDAGGHARGPSVVCRDDADGMACLVACCALDLRCSVITDSKISQERRNAYVKLIEAFGSLSKQKIVSSAPNSADVAFCTGELKIDAGYFVQPDSTDSSAVTFAVSSARGHLTVIKREQDLLF